jgi:hypothetical protein
LSAAVIAYAFMALVVVGALAGAWWIAYDHGVDNTRAKELKRRADAAEKAARELARETPIPSRYRRMLRRMRERGNH